MTSWEGLMEPFLNNCRFKDHQFRQFWKKTQVSILRWEEKSRDHQGSSLNCLQWKHEENFTSSWTERVPTKKVTPAPKSTPSSSTEICRCPHRQAKTFYGQKRQRLTNWVTLTRGMFGVKARLSDLRKMYQLVVVASCSGSAVQIIKSLKLPWCSCPWWVDVNV